MPLIAALRTIALLALMPGAAAAQGPAAAAIDPAQRGAERSFAFKVDWGPVGLAEVTLDLTETPDGGAMARASGASLGLAAMFSRFTVDQNVTYTPDGHSLYVSQSRFGDTESRRVVRFPADAPPEVVEHHDPRPPEPLTPIAPDQMTGAVDPAFPVRDALRRVEAGQGCGGVWRTFDGVRRMDITLIDEGPDMVEADRDWTYGGPALRCRLRFERIGGFPPRASDAPAETDYDRVLWIADLPDGAVPVRLRVSWPLGYATGRIDLR